MNDADLRRHVVAAIRAVAPEVEEAELVDARALRDQVDLDSMDWLRVILAVHDSLGVEIPERDYGRLRTLDGWVAYLRERQGGTGRAPP